MWKVAAHEIALDGLRSEVLGGSVFGLELRETAGAVVVGVQAGGRGSLAWIAQFDVADGALLRITALPQPTPCEFVDLLLAGTAAGQSLILVVSSDGQVVIWDLNNQRWHSTLELPSYAIDGGERPPVAVTPHVAGDSPLLFCAKRDGSSAVIAFELVPKVRLLEQLKMKPRGVDSKLAAPTALACHPHRTLLAVGCVDGQVRLWDFDAGVSHADGGGGGEFGTGMGMGMGMGDAHSSAAGGGRAIELGCISSGGLSAHISESTGASSVLNISWDPRVKVAGDGLVWSHRGGRVSLVRGIVLGSGGGSGASGGASGVVHGPLHTRMLAGSPQVLSMGFCACTSSGPASVILLLQPRGTAPCIHCWDADQADLSDMLQEDPVPGWVGGDAAVLAIPATEGRSSRGPKLIAASGGITGAAAASLTSVPGTVGVRDYFIGACVLPRPRLRLLLLRLMDNACPAPITSMTSPAIVRHERTLSGMAKEPTSPCIAVWPSPPTVFTAGVTQQAAAPLPFDKELKGLISTYSIVRSQDVASTGVLLVQHALGSIGGPSSWHTVCNIDSPGLDLRTPPRLHLDVAHSMAAVLLPVQRVTDGSSADVPGETDLMQDPWTCFLVQLTADLPLNLRSQDGNTKQLGFRCTDCVLWNAREFSTTAPTMPQNVSSKSAPSLAGASTSTRLSTTRAVDDMYFALVLMQGGGSVTARSVCSASRSTKGDFCDAEHDASAQTWPISPPARRLYATPFTRESQSMLGTKSTRKPVLLFICQRDTGDDGFNNCIEVLTYSSNFMHNATVADNSFDLSVKLGPSVAQRQTRNPFSSRESEADSSLSNVGGLSCSPQFSLKPCERIVQVLWQPLPLQQSPIEPPVKTAGAANAFSSPMLAVLTTRRLLMLSASLQRLAQYSFKRSRLPRTLPRHQATSCIWLGNALLFSTTSGHVRYLTAAQPSQNLARAPAEGRLVCALPRWPSPTAAQLRLVAALPDRLIIAEHDPIGRIYLRTHPLFPLEPLVLGELALANASKTPATLHSMRDALGCATSDAWIKACAAPVSPMKSLGLKFAWEWAGAVRPTEAGEGKHWDDSSDDDSGWVDVKKYIGTRRDEDAVFGYWRFDEGQSGGKLRMRKTREEHRERHQTPDKTQFGNTGQLVGTALKYVRSTAAPVAEGCERREPDWEEQALSCGASAAADDRAAWGVVIPVERGGSLDLGFLTSGHRDSKHRSAFTVEMWTRIYADAETIAGVTRNRDLEKAEGGDAGDEEVDVDNDGGLPRKTHVLACRGWGSDGWPVQCDADAMQWSLQVAKGGAVQAVFGGSGISGCTITGQGGDSGEHLIHCVLDPCADQRKRQQWYHVAMAVDLQRKEPSAKLYLNGVELQADVTGGVISADCVPSAPQTPTSDKLVLGLGLHGEIAEVRLWGGMRSETSISERKDFALDLASKTGTIVKIDKARKKKEKSALISADGVASTSVGTCTDPLTARVAELIVRYAVQPAQIPEQGAAAGSGVTKELVAVLQQHGYLGLAAFAARGRDTTVTASAGGTFAPRPQFSADALAVLASQNNQWQQALEELLGDQHKLQEYVLQCANEAVVQVKDEIIVRDDMPDLPRPGSRLCRRLRQFASAAALAGECEIARRALDIAGDDWGVFTLAAVVGGAVHVGSVCDPAEKQVQAARKVVQQLGNSAQHRHRGLYTASCCFQSDGTAASKPGTSSTWIAEANSARGERSRALQPFTTPLPSLKMTDRHAAPASDHTGAALWTPLSSTSTAAGQVTEKTQEKASGQAQMKTPPPDPTYFAPPPSAVGAAPTSAGRDRKGREVALDGEARALKLVCLPQGESGTLYENAMLLIQACRKLVASKRGEHFLHLSVEFTNKSQAAVDNLRAQVESNPALLVVTSHEVVARIPPGQKQVLEFKLQMKQPSASPPRFHITFVHDGTSRTLSIYLPALLSCFVQPVPMTAAAFDAKWSKLRTDKGQEKDIFMVPKGEGAIRWLLATGMQLSVVGALDSTDVSSSALATPICASGVFRCLGFPRGFGCLLRIDFRDHEVHATARTTNDKVSDAFVSALAALWKH